MFKMNFKKFITSRGVILATIVSILYGCLIFAIYFTGYQAMPKHVDELTVTVVNRNKNTRTLADQIEKGLPFKHIKKVSSLRTAKKQLHNKKTAMIIEIPWNFKSRISSNSKTNLNFYIDEATPYSQVSALKTVSQKIGYTVNQQVIIEKGKAMLLKEPMTGLEKTVQTKQAQLQNQLQAKKQQIAQAPEAQQPRLEALLKHQELNAKQKLEAQVKQQSKAIRNRVSDTYQDVDHSVGTNLVRVHPVKTGMNHALAPFIANIAVYLGTLIGALLLYGTYAKFVPIVGRFKSFAFLETAAILLSIIGSLFTSWSITGFMGLGGSQFANLWLNHGLEIFGSLNFNLILVLLLGQIGTALNIFLTMIQVVSGAGMIPLVTLNSFFKGAHYISPMFYSIQADFNIMFGGSQAGMYLGQLVLLALGILIVNIVIVTFRKHQPILDFHQLS
ncbi:hypothetical protein GQR93_14275 [Lentilactobacillus hilgardii]|uniref:DUF3533 domain-containing protein n=2 Tax=Lentilactobacillus hilgardii TaxID=1588 RepID=A0A6P1EER4_LENHI|nr:hypothetical protein [Lentilactobacillus hilgardii]MCT3398453.1 hypothetical protein [Lentilactobacillus hilgardii]QHB53273.1 hypothetical protein GQR93_14275 [Lentilactobacillus hilgardii]RRG07810.1 MAG: hypothetical protein DUD35_12790 [Lactobacillus sp.]